MRRITMWILSTVSALVLLFSYRTSTAGTAGVVADTAAGAAGGSTTNGTTANGTTGSGTTGSGSYSAGSTTTGGSATGTGTYDGSVAQTRWGPVQVRITVQNGRITEVQTLQVPNSNMRDREINNRAVPVLRQEALAAQSADIDTVSGATVTSDGYRQSLQAAIDSAHLG